MELSRIMLDSTAFGERSFLAWLRINLKHFNIFVSPIVYAETALWYLYSGLSIEDLEDDLLALKAEVPPITKEIMKIAAKKAYINRRHLPFRHHARDYVIGAQAIALHASIVTSNKKHFEWVSEINVFSPEEFVERTLKDLTD